MKFFFELVPLIAFFVALIQFDIYVATIVLMVAIPLQMLGLWYFFKKLDKMHWVTLAVVMVFGAATLLFKDPIFIKWKPTIVNWGFALAFIGSKWFAKKPLIQYMLGRQLVLSDEVWHKLNISWVIFFILLGVLNLYFAYTFDTITWAKFKVFGMLALTFVFVIGQGIYLSRYLKDSEGKNDN